MEQHGLPPSNGAQDSGSPPCRPAGLPATAAVIPAAVAPEPVPDPAAIRHYLNVCSNQCSPCSGTSVAPRWGTVAPVAGHQARDPKGRHMQACGLVFTAPGQVTLQP